MTIKELLPVLHEKSAILITQNGTGNVLYDSLLQPLSRLPMRIKNAKIHQVTADSKYLLIIINEIIY